MKEFVFEKRMYLDGALGSRILAEGFLAEPKINIEHPEVVEKIHLSYLEAGADIIAANTFLANALKCENVDEVIESGLKIARKCADQFDAYVAYDCGPLGELLSPLGTMSFETAYSLFKQQAEAVKRLGLADIVFLETFSDLLEMKAAYLAFSDTLELPIFCSMSFEADGRTFTGCTAEAFARTMTALGAAAVGVNCGLGPDALEGVVKSIKSATKLPVICQPNAGIPKLVGGETVYDMDAEKFSDCMIALARSGADILGGCCGTDRTHIAYTIQKTKGIPLVVTKDVIPAVCSASKVVPLMKNHVKVVGERINPTGKPMLKQALLAGDLDYVLTVALEQVKDGAHILDINVGMAGIDEEKVLPEVVLQVQSVVDCPLQIDSVRAAAVEKAVKKVAGIPIINSVNADEKSMAEILPIAKKYGCFVVCLPLDEKGIPQDAHERLRLVDRIAARARQLGIPKERLIVDGLVMAVSVDERNAGITLSTVEAAKNSDFLTCLGISNISFGLPARDDLNAAFYEMAIESGLNLAIINPALKPQRERFDNSSRTPREKCAVAALRGMDKGFENYIKMHSNLDADASCKKEAVRKSSLKEAVLSGLKNDATELAKVAVTAENYLSVIETDIVGALTEIGEKYEAKQAFLPQLIAVSEASKAALDVIKSRFMQNSANTGEKVLMLTVKGDVHDIGKNIVKAILANYGYQVIDLGKNVDTATVLDAIKRESPAVVGLSALMTTTLDAMTETVKAIKAHHPNIKVMVGGAVVTEDYAKSIGALYGRDALAAVALLKG